MAVTAGSNPLDRVLDILGSKGGQTITNAVGAGLQSYGAGKQAEADRAASAAQFRANMAQRQQENDQADQRSRAVSAENASPLGADQSFAQKQMLLKAILGSSGNFSATPGDPRVAGAMGHMTGGLRLPEGGLDHSSLERLFGDEATQSSIAQHAKAVGQINPHAPMVNLAPMFGASADGSENAFQTDIRTANAQEADRQAAETARQRAIIQQAIDEDIRGAKQPKGSKAKSALGSAASGAMAGSMFGPWGAAVGGIGGFLKGLF